jgi:hypothetical protein
MHAVGAHVSVKIVVAIHPINVDAVELSCAACAEQIYTMFQGGSLLEV